ncbi:SRPBCC family protein [Gordonia neofelifaecis]|uniref:Cyclase/dehydrase n=1 Tax=Gordonia neofelifaecis NRRL B-59395 TaxID=644548 RepID=F1YIM8_9ACTN|nr:SRPBCC family protein [Gordonia neofelifaecis]EGD55336.1 cyclase/dehydrase [Gordonia neofelifaecis NRRL B-59395]
MRLRDSPTVEVSRELRCAPEHAWQMVTDISLPTRAPGELQRVEWLDGADAVTVGARFSGHNRNEQMGDWQTISVITEVEPGRRWVWTVGPDSKAPFASWGFEVDPMRDGTIVRQWARIGDAESPFKTFIDAHPDREGEIIAFRLGVWQRAMEANLAVLEAALS